MKLYLYFNFIIYLLSLNIIKAKILIQYREIRFKLLNIFYKIILKFLYSITINLLRINKIILLLTRILLILNRIITKFI